MKTRAATLIVALTAAACAVPLAAQADPPAAAVPIPPVPFAGAPSNQDPNAGQFTLNFDDGGRFLGTGRPAEHYANFALGQTGVERSQAGNAPTREVEKRAVNRLFVRFADRLRSVSNPPTAMR